MTEITEEDEEYAEWLSDIMLSYFAAQLNEGRQIINESELWELLGAPFPEGREDKPFVLKEFVDKPVLKLKRIEYLDDNNVIDFTNYKKLH